MAESRVRPPHPTPPTPRPAGPHLSVFRRAPGLSRRSGRRRGSRLPRGLRRHGAPPRLRARADRRRPPGYLRRRGRRACELGSAFFPTLAPANERLRSPSPLPPAHSRAARGAARPRPRPPPNVSQACAPGPRQRPLEAPCPRPPPARPGRRGKGACPRLCSRGRSRTPAPGLSGPPRAADPAPPRPPLRAGRSRSREALTEAQWSPGGGGARSSRWAAREI